MPAPGDPDGDALAAAAVQRLIDGDAAGAVELLERAVAGEPTEPTHLTNLGAALQQLGRLDEAAAALRRARQLRDQPSALLEYNLGTVLQTLGDLDGAESAYRAALVADPGLAAALGNLGTVLQQRGDLVGAVDAYRRAVALDPGGLHARCNLGGALLALGDLDAAERVMRDAVDAAPDQPRARVGLAAVLGARGGSDAALPALRRALELESVPGDAHRHLASLLTRGGQLTEAETGYLRSIEDDPADARLHTSYGVILEQLGLYPEAGRAFRRAIAIRPDWAAAHYNLGVIHERLGRLDEACAAYDRALALDPDDVRALGNRAGVLHNLGRPDDAARGYARILEIDPANQVAAHLHAALRGETTAGAPPGYVRKVFDEYADRYEQHMVELLGYRVPEQMRTTIVDVMGAARFGSALDLGCGTGLVGAAVRDLVDELHGVDLSPAMVAQVSAGGRYHRVWEAELVEFLQRGPGRDRYDLVTAADVLIYVGRLEPLFAALTARLAPGALVVLSVERAAADEPAVVLRDTGRYAHRPDDVERQAAEASLAVAACRPVELRRQGGRPVDGVIYALVAPR